MALTDIRAEIRAEVGGRTDIDSLIDDQINFAISEYTTMYEFPALEATATAPTVSGKPDYLLPSDLYILWWVKEETTLNKLLERKRIEQYDSMDETKTGTPSFFAEFNRTMFVFNSVPDNNAGSNYSLRIRYWKTHPTLSADGDALLTPAEWERGIRLKATAFTMNVLDMPEKAAAIQQELDRWMGRIKLPRAGGEEKAKIARMNFGAQR